MFFFTVVLSYFLLNSYSIVALNDTLIFVQTISRHGARSPILTYPHDNYNESQWFQGYGQLTEKGMRMALELGAYYRKRYVEDHKLLSAQYNRNEIYVRSSDVDRTLLTARLSMEGLYPLPHPIPHPLNPVPVHTIAKETDHLLYNGDCILYERRVTGDYLREEFRKKSDKYEDFVIFLNKHLKLGAESYEDICMVADNLMCQKFNNFSLPEWASDRYEGRAIYDFLMEFKNLEFEVLFNRYDLAKLKAGVLLGDLVKNLKNRVSPDSNFTKNAYFYYSHDTNLAPFLATLKLFDNLQPPFASTILVELYRNNDKMDNSSNNDSSDNDSNDLNIYYVKVLYRNDTTADPLELELPGCQLKCPLQTFLDLTRSNVVYDWDEVCVPKKMMPYKDILLYVTAGLLIICVLLLLLCTALRCRKGAPYHRYVDVPTEIE